MDNFGGCIVFGGVDYFGGCFMFDCGDGCGLCFRLCDLYFFGWIVVGVNGGEYIGVGGLFVFSGKFVVLYWCFC